MIDRDDDTLQALASQMRNLEKRLAQHEQTLVAEREAWLRERQDLSAHRAVAVESEQRRNEAIGANGARQGSVPRGPTSDSAKTRGSRGRAMRPRRSNAPSSRRALLTWGGAAAAATIAALASEQVTHASPANDGSTIIAGQVNTASSTTTLQNNVGTTNPVMVVDCTQSGGTGDALRAFSANGSAVYGSSPNGWGVYGSGNNHGVYGLSPNGYAVTGESSGGIGVYGISTNGGEGVSGHGGAGGSSGVAGYATGGGAAVYAVSTSGWDIFAAGTGRVLINFQTFTGPPTGSGTSYIHGEMIRDAAGDLYICMASGSPGIWKKVAAIPGGTTGGANVLFAAPFRIFDTRPGVGALGGGGPMAPGQTITVQVTGTVDPKDNSIVAPAGATGIIGDLIAITPAGSGFLGIQPSVMVSNPYAWVNYQSGVTIHNSVMVGLSSDGKVDIQCNQASAGAALTITGYII